jgi:hypothetical protein
MSKKISSRSTFYRNRKRGIYEWNTNYLIGRNSNQNITGNNNTSTVDQVINENEIRSLTAANDQIFDSDIQSHQDNQDNQDDNLEDLQNLVLTNDAITLETKCAILLTAFFEGKMTQASFKTFLKAINCFTSLDTPTTFDGVANILLRHEDQKIIFNKKLFCNRCKVFQEIQNRFERNCSICDER